MDTDWCSAYWQTAVKRMAGLARRPLLLESLLPARAVMALVVRHYRGNELGIKDEPKMCKAGWRSLTEKKIDSERL